jgi:AraC-like DNA-binding protein
MTENVSALFDLMMRGGRRIDDVAEARAQMARAFLPHRWDVRDGGDGFELLHGEMRLGGIAINAVSYNREMLIDCPAFEDFLCVHFSADGECDYRTGTTRGRAGEGIVYVSGPEQRFRQEMSASYRQVTIKVQRHAIERFLAGELGLPLDIPLRFSPDPHPIDGEAASLLRLLAMLCANHAARPGEAAPPFVRVHAERMLMATLLAGLPNNYQRACTSGDHALLPYHLKRAERFIMRHLGDAIDVDAISRAAGASRRTVTSAFRQYLGLSPMAYLKLRRLEQARMELAAAAAAGRSVTDIALACGFNHLGRFARDYAGMFGEAPSITLRTGRLPGATRH